MTSIVNHWCRVGHTNTQTRGQDPGKTTPIGWAKQKPNPSPKDTNSNTHPFAIATPNKNYPNSFCPKIAKQRDICICCRVNLLAKFRPFLTLKSWPGSSCAIKLGVWSDVFAFIFFGGGQFLGFWGSVFSWHMLLLLLLLKILYFWGVSL